MTWFPFMPIYNYEPEPPVYGGLLELNGSELTVAAYSANSQEAVPTLGLFNGSIFAGTGDGGNLQQQLGDPWYPSSLLSFSSGVFTEEAVVISNQFQLPNMLVFDDELFAATGTGGNLVALDGVTATRSSLLEFTGSAFAEVAPVESNQTLLTGLIEHNSLLYAVTGNSGNLLEYSP